MARPRKMTLDDQIRKYQEEYVKYRKRCEELAKEIDRLSRLRDEEKAKELIRAIEKSGKSYEEVMAFLTKSSEE